MDGYVSERIRNVQFTGFLLHKTKPVFILDKLENYLGSNLGLNNLPYLLRVSLWSGGVHRERSPSDEPCCLIKLS